MPGIERHNASDMNDPSISRRQFLVTASAAAGGLLLSGSFAVNDVAAQTPGVPIALNAWVRIAPDNTVTLIASQAEMGQGIQTSMAALLAEELGADWAHVALEDAPADPAYRNPRLNWQFTGNSESTTAFFDLMRQMGAQARGMLIAAAADAWRVGPESCRVERGTIVHAPSGRRVTFGDVAASAAAHTPASSPRLKMPREWTLVGKPLPRIESHAKVNGTAVYGIDVVRPEMAFAAVKTSPQFGGEVGRVDKAAVAQMPGVVDVVPIPNGIAVVAESYWQARTALAALPVEFRGGATTGSTALDAAYQSAMAGTSWQTVHDSGPADRTVATTFAETYESQFLAHATMEPMNCTAHVTGDRCDVWAPTQGQELTQLTLAQVLGLPRERITVNRTLLGGGFGRRLVADFAVQAALISRAVKRPVKVIWSREEDLQHDLYRPKVLHRLTAGIDEFGRLQSIDHSLVSPSILQFVYPPAVTDVFDPSCCEGVLETRYRIPRQRVDFKLLKVDVPTSVLRTTGFGPNIFAFESFIDELAHRKGQDPYRYRRELLRGDARALKVLDLAAQQSRWSTPAPRGRFRGIAFCEAFRTLTAHVVEISIPEENAIKVHRIVCVADAGIVLDPEISANSLEGGAAWGLTCAFHSDITFDAGRVVQSNFHDYPMLRLPQMPPVEVFFAASGVQPLGGIGEVGPVTLVPALVNAIFAATGQRYRSLPLSRHGLRLV